MPHLRHWEGLAAIRFPKDDVVATHARSDEHQREYRVGIAWSNHPDGLLSESLKRARIERQTVFPVLVANRPEPRTRDLEVGADDGRMSIEIEHAPDHRRQPASRR